MNIDNANSWLESLPKVIETFKGVDLLIFNAGVDARVDDFLGGKLATEHLERRDNCIYGGTALLVDTKLKMIEGSIPY